MADKYDKNGYGGDFKRSAGPPPDSIENDDDRLDLDEGGEGGCAPGGGGPGAPGGGAPGMAERAGDYMRDLLQEKLTIDHNKFPICVRLIDQG